MSDSLQPHEPQHARPPCPSPTPRVYPNPHPLSRWCHLTISSSVVPFSSCLQSFPAIRVFSNDSALRIKLTKYWSFSFNISPFNEHPGLISFRMDWLDLLAVQETLKSLLQHHSSKASTLLCSAFFIIQLSHPYMTTGKTIALTRQTFVNKVTSLLFNMLSRWAKHSQGARHLWYLETLTSLRPLCSLFLTLSNKLVSHTSQTYQSSSLLPVCAPSIFGDVLCIRFQQSGV